MSRERLAGIAALFFVGVFVGAGCDNPPTEYRVVPRTVTETKEVEVPVSTLPIACEAALVQTNKIVKSVNGIDSAGAFLLDSLSDARIAVAEGDTMRLNAIQNGLIDRRERLTGYFLRFAEQNINYTDATLNCKEQLK